MIKSLKVDKSLLAGAGAIIFAALLWSLDGVFIRPKFYTLPAGLLVFLEHLFGFIVLSTFIILKWPRIKILRRKDWGAILWICAFGGLLGTLMITKAFFAAVAGEVTFATVVILQKLQPVFALIMARLILKEKLSKRFYAWAVIAIAAGYFLAFGKEGFNLGEINLFHHAAWFAFLAAFAFGSSTVFGKRAVSHLDFRATGALRFGITAGLALIYVVSTGDLFKIGEVSPLYWKFLILIVIIQTTAIFFYYFGLKRVSASSATIFELAWPLSAVLLDYILNKNFLNNTQLVASLILLIAFFQIVKKGKAKEIEFSAKVISGQGRGQRIGFPTINLDTVDLDIDYGVYSVEAGVGVNNFRGLLHFGPKDTFSEKTSLELYLSEKIPGIEEKNIKIRMTRKIREVEKFKNVDKLKKQIKVDLEEIE